MPISLRVIRRYKSRVIDPIMAAIGVMNFAQSKQPNNGATDNDL